MPKTLYPKVQAPVVNAGPTDFGGDQVHDQLSKNSEDRVDVSVTIEELEKHEESCMNLESVEEKLLSEIRAAVKYMVENTNNRSNLDSCIKNGLLDQRNVPSIGEPS